MKILRVPCYDRLTLQSIVMSAQPGDEHEGELCSPRITLHLLVFLLNALSKSASLVAIRFRAAWTTFASQALGSDVADEDAGPVSVMNVSIRQCNCSS
jgi:hypothetical protein